MGPLDNMIVTTSPPGGEVAAAFGGDSGGDTPVPIPNTAVKPASADGTWAETPWESRTPPDFSPFGRGLRASPEGRFGHGAAPDPPRSAVTVRGYRWAPGLVSGHALLLRRTPPARRWRQAGRPPRWQAGRPPRWQAGRPTRRQAGREAGRPTFGEAGREAGRPTFGEAGREARWPAFGEAGRQVRTPRPPSGRPGGRPRSPPGRSG